MIVPITRKQRGFAYDLAKRVFRDKGRPALTKPNIVGDYQGFLGETVVADTYGVSRPELLPESGDRGFDLLINGVRVGVKAPTFRYKQPAFIVDSNLLNKTVEDVFVQAHLNLIEGYANLRGINRVDFVRKAGFRVFNRAYGPCFFVEWKELMPVERILPLNKES